MGYISKKVAAYGQFVLVFSQDLEFQDEDIVFVARFFTFGYIL